MRNSTVWELTLVFGRQILDNRLSIPGFLLKKDFQGLLQNLSRHKQFRREAVRLDLLVVDRKTRHRIPEPNRGSVDIHLSFVKHEMPDLVGNHESLVVDVVGAVQPPIFSAHHNTGIA